MAETILYDPVVSPRFLVSGQKGGKPGAIDSFNPATKGANGEGGLLIISSSLYAPSDRHWDLGTNTFGNHTLPSTNGGHGSVTGGPRQVFLITPPTLAIATPPPDSRVSNAVVRVAGTARDNQAVQSVEVRLNSGAWHTASTQNGWTNWFADVGPLSPGPNLLEARAMDTSTNYSIVVPRTIAYVVSALLEVEFVGCGKVSPEYDSTWLEIGTSYSMTATPCSGYRFSNWTDCEDTVLTNLATLRFAMQSNLCFRAHFVDGIRPVVAVRTPASGARLTDAAITLSGRATDNSGDVTVYCQLNGEASWLPATGTTNWTAALVLKPGLNTVRVYAEDADHNRSITNQVTYTYVAYDRLRIEVVGSGKISPNSTNQWIEVGKSVTLTANPARGQVFSNWMQMAPAPIAALTHQATLKFTMQSNVVLRANFVPNPFLALKGTYRGLFFPNPQVYPDQQEVTNSGSFKLTLTDKGVASGSVAMGVGTYAFSGLTLDLDGRATRQLKRKAPLAPLELELDLDLADATGVLHGQVSGTGWASQLLAYLVRGDTNQAGRYTFVLPGGDVTDTNQPTGYGAGTITVDKQGSVRLAGRLGEGTSLSVASGLSAEGWCPLHAPLYGGRGMMLGWVRFGTNDPMYDAVGTNLWVKAVATRATDKYYRDGFAVHTALWGSRYVAPKTGQSVMDWTNGVVWIEGGNLLQALTNRVLWAKNRLVLSAPNTHKVVLSMTPSDGLWSGRFLHPETRRTTTMRGALLQGPGWGAGWFLGTHRSGPVMVIPDQDQD